MELTPQMEIALGQYERARSLYGEDSSEARELLERLEVLTVTAESRPDPEMNDDLPLTK
jgi:hypothetical protein